jgi:hypothetical protein
VCGTVGIIAGLHYNQASIVFYRQRGLPESGGKNRMNRQEQQNRQKQQQAAQQQRQLRRNQIIFVVLSGILILSMILSLVINI